MLSRQFIAALRLRRDKIAAPGDYPFNLPAIRALGELPLHPGVTFLVGENGSGKSTLLEAIAVAWGFNPEGGSRNFNFHTHESHSDLHKYLTLVKGVRRPRDGYFLRAEGFFNVATEIERLDEIDRSRPLLASYGGKSLHVQSHGESFHALMFHRFGGDGLYLLDEPEAAMSPQRQLALVARMHELVRQGSQFIIATHSPIFMSYPESCLYQLDQEGIAPRKPEDVEHYRVLRDFLAHPARSMRILMGELTEHGEEE